MDRQRVLRPYDQAAEIFPNDLLENSGTCRSNTGMVNLVIYPEV